MNRNRRILIVIVICYIVLLTVLLLAIVPPAIQVIEEELFRHINVGAAVIIVVGLVCCLTMLVLTLIHLSQKNVKGDISKDRINRMDDERNYLEQQIIDLNKKLVSTEDRLEEAFHLVFSTQNKQTDKAGEISATAFLNGFGIDVNNVEIQGDLAFVLTPFHDAFNSTYEMVRETCQNMKLKPMRGDEEFIANDILKHIIKQIVKARLVIAILDGRNPNVFYELGIVHSLNKPTILLANASIEVPFDLQNRHLVLYKNETDLKEKLSNAILNILTLS